MSPVRCQSCRHLTSRRSPRCYHCGAELEPRRLLSAIAIGGFAIAVVTAAAAVILGVPAALRVIANLQQIDDVFRVWRVGIALAFMLLLAIFLRWLTRPAGWRSTYVAPNVAELAESAEPRRQ